MMMTKSKTDRHTHVKIRICAYPEYLSLVRAAVRSVAAKIGLNVEQVDSITLAVQEAMTNVIKHSYGCACDEEIVIKLSHIQGPKYPEGAMEIAIRDYGSTIEPEDICSRDLDEVRPGGLGVHIMKTIMDECNYCKMAEKGLELKMVKAVK